MQEHKQELHTKERMLVHKLVQQQEHKQGHKQELHTKEHRLVRRS